MDPAPPCTPLSCKTMALGGGSTTHPAPQRGWGSPSPGQAARGSTLPARQGAAREQPPDLLEPPREKRATFRARAVRKNLFSKAPAHNWGHQGRNGQELGYFAQLGDFLHLHVSPTRDVKHPPQHELWGWILGQPCSMQRKQQRGGCCLSNSSPHPRSHHRAAPEVQPTVRNTDPPSVTGEARPPVTQPGAATTPDLHTPSDTAAALIPHPQPLIYTRASEKPKTGSAKSPVWDGRGSPGFIGTEPGVRGPGVIVTKRCRFQEEAATPSSTFAYFHGKDQLCMGALPHPRGPNRPKIARKDTEKNPNKTHRKNPQPQHHPSTHTHFAVSAELGVFSVARATLTPQDAIPVVVRPDSPQG